MFNFRKKNLMQQREEELSILKQDSSRAVDVVTTTINQLSSVNESIDMKESQVNQEIERLNGIKTGLSETRLKNTKIISKFRNFIED